jgi:hypothetical protein
LLDVHHNANQARNNTPTNNITDQGEPFWLMLYSPPLKHRLCVTTLRC